jgi:hypothetical protein
MAFLVSLLEVPPPGADGHPLVPVASGIGDSHGVVLEATSFTRATYILELRSEMPESLVTEVVSTDGEANRGRGSACPP